MVLKDNLVPAPLSWAGMTSMKMSGQVMSQDRGDRKIPRPGQSSRKFRYISPSAGVLLCVYTWWEQQQGGIMYPI